MMRLSFNKNIMKLFTLTTFVFLNIFSCNTNSYHTTTSINRSGILEVNGLNHKNRMFPL